MEKTGASAVGESSQEQTPAGGPLSPARAFALVLAIAVVAAAVLYLTNAREDRAAPAAAPVTPDLSLTDAEAIAGFRELHALVVVAYRNRDLTLLPEIYVAGSGPLRRAREEIRGLLQGSALDKSKIVTRSLRVVSNSPAEIIVRQVRIVEPKFVDEYRGRDLTVSHQPERQVLEWRLRLQGSQWLVAGGRMIAATRTSRSDSR